MPADGFYGFNYSSKNYIFPHRAPFPGTGESRVIVSPLIFLSPFSSDSMLDRLARGPASWNDTLRTTFASCVPCLTCDASSRSSPNTYNGSDSDDKYTNNATHSPRTHRRKGGGTTTPQPTPTPSRSTHTSGPGGGAPPRTPRHISLWGFNLFGNGRGRGVALEGGDDVLHSKATPGLNAPPKRSGKKQRGSCSETAPGASTDDLLARRSSPRPRSSRMSAPRTSPGARAASHLEGGVETEQERRVPLFRVWKAAAAADLLRAAAGVQWDPLSLHEAEQQQWPPADALAHLAAPDDEYAADLDGLAYALLAQRGVGGSQSQSGSSGRSSFSRSVSLCFSFVSLLPAHVVLLNTRTTITISGSGSRAAKSDSYRIFRILAMIKWPLLFR
ncbi:hypothetical protein B0H13DRAFT_2413606 [Mycena leptocephala]|nr:hypothetical protein B0H13DRAFT_2413606 [Mycena leptocephala]